MTKRRHRLMRRSDREVTDKDEIIVIMKKCDVCRLALNGDDGYPYILPLNFGLLETDGWPALYFHGATEGRKYGLMERDSRACFEMDCCHRLVSDAENSKCTMEYESVIGIGHIEPVDEKDKLHALELLNGHYHRNGFPVNRSALDITRVFRLVIESASGKRRKVHS